MRSKLGKECRKQFRKMMATEFSEFHEDKSQVVLPGWYTWTQKHASGLFFHIILVLSPKRDEFMTEAAWNWDGRLPSVESVSDDILSAPAYFRTSQLWIGFVDGLWVDYWWLLVLRVEEFKKAYVYKDDPIEECLPLVAPAIDDATNKLKDYLVPVFEEVVWRHGQRGPACQP